MSSEVREVAACLHELVDRYQIDDIALSPLGFFITTEVHAYIELPHS